MIKSVMMMMVTIRWWSWRHQTWFLLSAEGRRDRWRWLTDWVCCILLFPFLATFIFYFHSYSQILFLFFVFLLSLTAEMLFFSSWLFAQIRIFSRLFLLFACQMWLYRKLFGVTDQNLCSIILVWILHLSSGYCFLFHFKLIIGRLSDTIILFSLDWSGKNFHFQINSLVLL